MRVRAESDRINAGSFVSSPKSLFRRDMDGGVLTNASHLVQIQSTVLLRKMKG